MKAFLKIATLFGIGGVVCFLIFALREPQAQDKPAGDVIATQTEPSAVKQPAVKEEAAKRGAALQQRGARTRQGEVDFGENEAFYRVIIDNNIFRPLGWKNPKEEPSYSLLGTVVDTDTGIAQAILLEKRSNRHYFVSIGEKVGDVTVKDIQPKQVVLDEEGKAITLKAGSLQFLTQPRRRGDEARAGEAAKANEGEKAAANGAKAAASTNPQANQFKNNPELAEKWRNASPEDRRKIEEYMRNQRAQRREQRERARENRGDRGSRRARGTRGERGRDR